MKCLAIFLLGAAVGSVGVVFAWPEPPPVEEQPVRLVRMLDITFPSGYMDKNTTNRRQRFICEEARR